MIDKYTSEEMMKIKNLAFKDHHKYLLLSELGYRFDKLTYEMDESQQELYKKLVIDLLKINVTLFEGIANSLLQPKHVVTLYELFDFNTFSILTIDEIKKCIELVNNFDIEKEDENNI